MDRRRFGYGDLTPATDLDRSLAMVETLFGQVFLVVLVAFLVGMLGRDRLPGRAYTRTAHQDCAGRADGHEGKEPTGE